MKAHIEHDPATRFVLIWLIQETYPAGPAVFYPEDPVGDIDPGGPSIKLIGEGGRLTDLPPSIRLPYDAFDALVDEGMDFAPPDKAQAAHLADAREVRDRLLVLVEAAWPSP